MYISLIIHPDLNHTSATNLGKTTLDLIIFDNLCLFLKKMIKIGYNLDPNYSEEIRCKFPIQFNSMPVQFCCFFIYTVSIDAVQCRPTGESGGRGEATLVTLWCRTQSHDPPLSCGCLFQQAASKKFLSTWNDMCSLSQDKVYWLVYPPTHNASGPTSLQPVHHIF